MGFATVTTSRVMIVCTAFAAVIALAVLVPQRATATFEMRMDRATELLAKRTDADSQAAVALWSSHRNPDQSLRLMEQASLLAPERADLVWLHTQLCQDDPACDPEPLESRLRDLDENNGVGWLGALDRAGKRGDEEAMSAALAAIGRAGRVDTYWTTLLARLSRQIASTRAVSLHEAQTNVIGLILALPIPYRGATDACKGERLTDDDVVELCRGAAHSLMNGDTTLTELIGASIAKRTWPENSPKWMEAAEAPRIWEYRSRFGRNVDAWAEAHGNDYLVLLEQHRREQDVYQAVLIAAGKDPNPTPAE